MKTLQQCLEELATERPLQPDEYLDPKSGLPCCKRCHSPRRIRKSLFGRERLLPIACKCQQNSDSSGKKNTKKQEK